MDLIIRLVADGLVFVVSAIGAYVFFTALRDDHYQRLVRAFMAGLTSYTVAKLLSLFYQTIERPFVTLGVEPKAAYLNNPGFPSDHALFVMTITLIVWATTGRINVTLLLLLLSVLVGVGRIVALVHTPQDIIGGYLAAFVGVGIWFGFFTRIKKRY